MVGSALVRILQSQRPDWSLLLAGRKELDLLNQTSVDEFIKSEKPDIIINAAARVGGIHANSTYPAEFDRQEVQHRSVRTWRGRRHDAPRDDPRARRRHGPGVTGVSPIRPHRQLPLCTHPTPIAHKRVYGICAYPSPIAPSDNGVNY